MKLIMHRSPLALEAELCDRIAVLRETDPLAPLLVVVPSRRLAEHVGRRLVERLGCVLGVEILHHHALAWRILETAGRPQPVPLGEPLREMLLARALRDAPTGALRDFARGRPGALAALRATLDDLRDAGIEPEAAAGVLRGAHAEIASLHAALTRQLDEVAHRAGAMDPAGLAREAAPHAAAFGSRFVGIFHHGAYDLIGVRLDLLRSLDAGREITFLLPADPDDASGAFGRERAAALPVTGTIALERATPESAATCAQLPSARAELTHAIYASLAAVASGTPPHEVAIVLRSFDPYASALDAWLDGLPGRWHTSILRPLRREPAVAEALSAIGEAPTDTLRTPAEHARRWRDAVGDTPLSGSIEALGQIETVLGETRAISHHEAAERLTRFADLATAAPAGADGGGIRVLDAMQARGLTFERIALVGLNAGVFPRTPREDPFLPDAARRRLIEATSRPLPLASEGEREERLLLAMLRGSARARVALSWRGADDDGRPLLPALALRGETANARALPLDPRSLLATWAEDPGVLAPGDEALLAALSSERGGDAGPAVVARRPELADGVALVRATDSFAPGDGRYDGRVGPAAARRPLAATAVDRLGACPLRFFFHHVLHVTAFSKPPTPFEADAASVGERVHRVLHDVFDELLRGEAFETLDLPARIERAREALARAWRASEAPEDAERASRLPGLARIEEARWMAVLGSFLAADLARMQAAGLVPETVETSIEGPVFRARLDRVLHGPGGRVVGDYKTGGNLARRARPAEMLTGAALQVAVYALMTGDPVELLGVGPAHAAKVDGDHDPRFVRFEGFDKTGLRDGIVETLDAVAALAEAGRFPLRVGTQCAYCDFAPACRRGHPPTEHREARADDVADVRDCWAKKAKAPTLALVREGRTP